MSDEQPSLEFIASQLRKPSGDFAFGLADKMDESNEPLFDLTLETMQVKDGQEILEIGFGSGSFVPKLLASAKNIKLKGIDTSAEMAELAKKNNAAAVAAGSFDPQAGDSIELPYPANTFEKVYCNMVIFFWDDPAKHLREIHRTLKPGGRFYSGFRSKKTMSAMPFTKFGFKLYDPDEWKVILENNGFRHINTNQSTDPAFQPPGSPIVNFESICMEAEKL